jgi:Xaa-Pro aminopeptidase
MSNQELARTRAELKKLDVNFVLLSSVENVTYASHFEVPINFGALATLSYVQPMALIGIDDNTACLLVSTMYGGWAQEQSTGFEVSTHDVFTGLDEISAQDNFLNSLRDTLKNVGMDVGSPRLAIEAKSLPAVVLRLLSDEFPNVDIINASEALMMARKVKTKRELGLLRFAAEVNKVGHEELLRQTREAGKNEFEMWAAIINQMEMKAGKALYVFGELVTGIRCRMVSYPGGPKDVVTQPGDLALMDMSPRVNGYWSDCTNTMVIGGIEPTQKQKLYGIAAREAFHAAADTLRPGRKASEVYAAASETFAKHGLEIGHYVGHQIGVEVNELPRLVPYDDTVIEAGMVFSSEPGSYEGPDGEAGARMEKSVIVHESGPEIICDFEWGF